MATPTLSCAERPSAVRRTGDERRPRAHAVSPGFRASYVVRLGLVVLSGAFAAGLVLCALLASNLGSYAQNVTIITGMQKWVGGAAALSALIQLALTGGLVGVLALLTSHKVAGPVARLGGLLRGVAEGRLPAPVAFRRGDQVGKVESEFNQLTRLLRERHEALQRQVRQAQGAVRELQSALRNPSGDARRAAAEDVLARASELASLLGGTLPRRVPTPPEPGGDIAGLLSQLNAKPEQRATEGKA